MKYFRNVELAKRYHVDESTVRKWIRDVKDSKLNLELVVVAERSFIADTAGNALIIEQLVANRKKYRNSKASKTVSPRPAFYKLYNQAQVYDIVRNLEIHREIPREYNYFDGGADHWDKHSRRLASEDSPNLLRQTIQLLAENQSYLDKRLEVYKHVNVIDIGPGNGLPVKDLLEHLHKQGKLARYIALDISEEMLEIAKRNVNIWLNSEVPVEGYELDINYERFSNIVAEEYLSHGAQETINLVLLLGGTPYNLRKPERAFQTINDSMNRHDLLVFSTKLATEGYLPSWLNPDTGVVRLAPIHRFIFDMLNIDESFYDVEMGYDRQKRQSYAQVRLKVALNIEFNFDVGKYYVELEKGDTILLWRARHVTLEEVVQHHERTDFHPLHFSQTDDQEYILAISRVKSEH